MERCCQTSLQWLTMTDIRMPILLSLLSAGCAFGDQTSRAGTGVSFAEQAGRVVKRSDSSAPRGANPGNLHWSLVAASDCILTASLQMPVAEIRAILKKPHKRRHSPKRERWFTITVSNTTILKGAAGEQIDALRYYAATNYFGRYPEARQVLALDHKRAIVFAARSPGRSLGGYVPGGYHPLAIIPECRETVMFVSETVKEHQNILSNYSNLAPQGLTNTQAHATVTRLVNDLVAGKNGTFQKLFDMGTNAVPSMALFLDDPRPLPEYIPLRGYTRPGLKCKTKGGTFAIFTTHVTDTLLRALRMRGGHSVSFLRSPGTQWQYEKNRKALVDYWKLYVYYFYWTRPNTPTPPDK